VCDTEWVHPLSDDEFQAFYTANQAALRQMTLQDPAQHTTLLQSAEEVPTSSSSSSSSSSSESSSSGSSHVHGIVSPVISSCDMSVGPCTSSFTDWTATQKVEVDQNNKEVLENLLPHAAERIDHFLSRLEEKDDTYVKLSSPVPNGHSVRFEVVYGSKDAFHKMAKEENLELEQNILTVDPKKRSKHMDANSKAAAERWASARAAGVPLKLPEVVNRILNGDQERDLEATNEGATRKLAYDARAQIREFLDKLAGAKIFVKLHGAVKHGHIIDYDLKSGSRTKLKKLAKESKLKANDFSIETGGDENSNVITGEAEETSTGFEADVVDTTAGDCVSYQC